MFENGKRGISDLAMDNILGGLLLQKLTANQFNIISRAQTFGNGDINIDKMWKIDELILLTQPHNIIVRQCYAITPRQHQQSFGAN